MCHVALRRPLHNASQRLLTVTRIVSTVALLLNMVFGSLKEYSLSVAVKLVAASRLHIGIGKRGFGAIPSIDDAGFRLYGL